MILPRVHGVLAQKIAHVETVLSALRRGPVGNRGRVVTEPLQAVHALVRDGLQLLLALGRVVIHDLVERRRIVHENPDDDLNPRLDDVALVLAQPRERALLVVRAPDAIRLGLELVLAHVGMSRLELLRPELHVVIIVEPHVRAILGRRERAVLLVHVALRAATLAQIPGVVPAEGRDRLAVDGDVEVIQVTRVGRPNHVVVKVVLALLDGGRLGDGDGLRHRTAGSAATSAAPAGRGPHRRREDAGRKNSEHHHAREEQRKYSFQISQSVFTSFLRNFFCVFDGRAPGRVPPMRDQNRHVYQSFPHGFVYLNRVENPLFLCDTSGFNAEKLKIFVAISPPSVI